MVPESERLSAELIAEARRRAGLTQTELARRAGTSQPAVAAYEGGTRQPTVPSLLKVLRAAGFDAHVTLQEEGGTSSGAQGYSPMTIAELGATLARSPDDHRRWRHVAEFLTEFGFEEEVARPALLTDEPSPTGLAHWDAFLGALAEHLAMRDGGSIPDWVTEPSRFLDRFWFPYETSVARADAIVTAPASFVSRGVFVERRDLERA